MPLSDKTREALLATSAMTRGALQRQYRYLASLLADEDQTVLQAALAGELQPTAEKVAALHETEEWRDRLISGDESQISEFINHYPECDRTHLRQLVRNAKKEREQTKPPKSSRQLFRYLRGLFEARTG